jgi:hypothetical protein
MSARRDWSLVFLWAWCVLGVTAVGCIVWWAHKDDARLTAECAARGGQLIEARSPLHVCVATPPPAAP